MLASRVLARRLAESAWRRWFLDRHAEFWLGELGLVWSPTAAKARVVEIIDETADTRTFVLAPGRRWPGHRAGQFVPVEVEIEGVRMRRCYSISSGASLPGARTIAITVKRVPGGRVSSWLHANVGPGDLLGLGTPAGDFVLEASETALDVPENALDVPENAFDASATAREASQTPLASQRPLLLVAGGSGITPIMAMLRDLESRGEARDVVLVHAARTDADAIFGRELAAMAAGTSAAGTSAAGTSAAGSSAASTSAIGAPAFRLIAHRDAIHGRLDAAMLLSLVPDLARREAYVCGPPGLIDLVTALCPSVHHERFVAPPPARPAHAPIPAGAAAAPVEVQLRGRSVLLAGSGSLLAELEQAGERPAHGCRMGICNSCRCRKRSGTVEDLLTGTVSSEPDQDIRLCVSIARSDLELAL